MATPKAEKIVIDAAAVAEVAKVRDAAPKQSDIDGAMPRECAVPAVDARGQERIDYVGVPLKNADGSPTKYAKSLVELHRPQAEAGAALSQRLAGSAPAPEIVVDRSGRKLPLPPRLAEAVAKARGFKPVPFYGKRRLRAVFRDDGETLYRRTDGTMVRLERQGGAIVEIPV